MTSSERFQPPRQSSPLPVEALRTYEDEAALDRVWARLRAPEGKDVPSARAPRSFAVARVALAAALVSLGFFAGRSFEREEERSVAALVSERLEPAGAAETAPTPELTPEPGEASAELAQRSAPSPLRSRSIRVPLGRGAPEEEDELGPAADDVPHQAEWLTIAEGGDLQGALIAIERQGGFDAVLASASVDELMGLADVARSAGRTGRAIQVLREVLSKHRGDANAPIAAMMLGNLLSQAGDAEGAARAYELHRRLSPAGDFAEDALLREFDMAVTARDLERAQRVLRHYETHYASGPHLREMRADALRLAEQLVAEKAARPGETEPSVLDLEDDDAPAQPLAPGAP